MYNEKNKKSFRKSTLIKLFVMCGALLLPILIFIILQNVNRTFETGLFISVSRYIIMLLVEIYISGKIIKYLRIMYSESFCKLSYIKRYDERENFLRSRAYNLTYKTTLFAIGLVLIISCYYSKPVFYTTSALLIILLGTYNISLMYFKNKY